MPPLPIAICLKKNKHSCGFILINVNFKNTNSVLIVLFIVIKTLNSKGPMMSNVSNCIRC